MPEGSGRGSCTAGDAPVFQGYRKFLLTAKDFLSCRGQTWKKAGF